MRIVYVCADRGIPLLGDKGASVHLRSLSAALAKRGNEVCLACHNLTGQNPTPVGVKVALLPDPGQDGEKWLSAFCREMGAEVVMERYSLSSSQGRAAATSLGIPLVLEVNAPLVDEAARYRNLDDLDNWRAWERRILSGADRVIGVSAGIKSHLESLGVEAKRITVIHNGANVLRFRGSDGAAVRARHHLGRALVIGFSGSLKPWHGVDSLLEAVASLSSRPRLLIVGDGPQADTLRRQSVTLGIADRTTFAGAVPHHLMPGYLGAMDLGVAPYVAQSEFYFSPLKVVEYLAAGLPVVATDQGDLKELVGDAGILVPAGDIPSLARALGGLCADAAERRRLSAAAGARSLDYDWGSIAERVESVLRAAHRVAA